MSNASDVGKAPCPSRTRHRPPRSARTRHPTPAWVHEANGCVGERGKRLSSEVRLETRILVECLRLETG
eukprot:50112-Eustigmatos_ZCMA.PRE.1